MKFWAPLPCSVVAAILALPLGTQAQETNLDPIITYDQEHPLVDMANLLPMVQVFSSGEVVIYRGPVMKNPGRYELQLSEEELAAIISLAETAGLLQVDVSEELESAGDDALLNVASDPTTSTFEFNRVSGQNVISAGDGTTTDATQTVVIDDVVLTASKVPNSVPVNALKDLHIQFIELFSQAGG